MKEIKSRRRNFLRPLGIGALALGILLPVVGLPVAIAKEAYPAKRITWINADKPGGGADIMARLICSYLPKYLREVSKGAKGGDVTIKNVPESGGRRAYSNIYHADPDGYLIGDFNNTFVTENIGSKIDEFDYNKFTFLARIGVSLPVLLVNKNGFKTWDEMMKAGQKKELKWACGNFGRSAHIASIMLKEAANVPGRFVNFPGSVESVNALMRGDVDIATIAEGTAKAMIQAGEFRVLAVITDTQAKRYPGVPTLAKLGFGELTEPLGQHNLIIGPPALPKEIVDILIGGIRGVFNDKEFVSQAFDKLNFTIDPLYGQEVASHFQRLTKFYEEKIPVLEKYLK